MTRLPSKDLKKFLLASVVAVGFALTAGPSHAATSDTILLSSTVGQDCSITVANKDGVLDIVAGTTDKKVADITETCNETAGYTITISSANAGNLEGSGALAGNPGASVDYTVSYDSASAADLATDATLARGGAVFGSENGLFVTVGGSSTRLAGSYEDTITVSIAAN